MRSTNQSGAGGWSPQWFCDSEDFQDYMSFTKDPVAAAILYASDRLANLLQDFDHQVSMGLKEGLSGIDFSGDR